MRAKRQFRAKTFDCCLDAVGNEFSCRLCHKVPNRCSVVVLVVVVVGGRTGRSGAQSMGAGQNAHERGDGERDKAAWPIQLRVRTVYGGWWWSVVGDDGVRLTVWYIQYIELTQWTVSESMTPCTVNSKKIFWLYVRLFVVLAFCVPNGQCQCDLEAAQDGLRLQVTHTHTHTHV